MTDFKKVDVGLQRKDFLSSVEPKWCGGCGDYAILKNLTSVFASLGKPKEDFLVVSGIGCSSRFPYYTDTYGVHTIHGRAPTFALGAKLANPNLSVWIVTGDGDALSIGTNHFIHLARRNHDVKLILFNNMIYGLTKGQLSPTSPLGDVTKTSKEGSIDRPISAVKLAEAAGASFIARTTDSHGSMMKDIFTQAASHKGTAIIEVLTNCVIFNDGIFGSMTQRGVRDDHTVILEEGTPLTYGGKQKKYLALDGFKPKVVEYDGDSVGADAITHKEKDSGLYMDMLASLAFPEFPIPLGILKKEERPAFEDSSMHGVSKPPKWGQKELEKFVKS